MGPRNRAQTGSAVHTAWQDLRTVTVGITRAGQVHQRTPRQRVYPTLEKSLRRTILLHQKERRQITSGTRLPTPERVDNTQSLSSPPHSPINQPRQDEEALHQVRRSLGVQQRAH